MKIKRLKNSFTDAWRGVTYTFRHEQNFKIQVILGLLVIIAMFLFDTRVSEKIVLLLLIILVWVLEFLNTIIEKFLDLLKPRLHDHVRVIKDVMAAAVLLSSLGALIIGLIIFIPYLFELLSR